MKRSYTFIVIVIVLALLSSASEAIAQEPSPFQPYLPQAGAGPQTALGTAFTYQGQLKNNGVPVNATCDFLFGLYDAPTGGNQFGSAVGSPNPTTVTNGLFTVQIDFGAGKLMGEARWLLITVRCPAGTGDFTILDPRQPLTPAPYALALPGLYTQQSSTSPNLIGGYNGNWVTSGTWGATIGGGGLSGFANRVTDVFGTVGGGRNNQAGDNTGTTLDKTDATVSGGCNNTAGGSLATVGGGYGNNASGLVATIGGGTSNTASGNYAIVPGGISNSAIGYSSFAAGRRAKANWDGSFVWGDATDADFASTAPNQFLIRASGNVGIGTNSPNATVHISGTNSTLRIQSTANNVWPRTMYQTDVRQWDTGVGGSAVTNDLNGKYYVFDATANQTRMVFDTNGNLGIGVTAPDQKMVVNGGAFTRLAIDSSANGNAGIQLRQGSASRWAMATTGTDGDFTIYEDDAAVNRLYIKGAGPMQGNVGIGTTTPIAKLHVISTPGIAVNATGAIGIQALGDQTAILASASTPGSAAIIAIGAGTTGRAADFRGNVRVLDQAGTNVVLEMGQGLDYAEGFNVSENHQIVPGMVLTIDPEHPGQLAMSNQAYDTRVAGIVAGAQNLGSGVRLGVDQFDRNVALAGRVYCFVDATDAAIEPGDLLTTSATPGYAMKAVDYTRAQGATLGKAMERMPKGAKGLILVLVTLQ